MSITRQFVESLDPKVKKVDSDEQLDLFCYTACSNEEDPVIQSCRGLIFHQDQLVLKAFSYTPDYTTEDIDQLKQTYPEFEKYSFFDSYEGTLIRIFHHQKWYVSTHRRLDAFKSKWAAKASFGELFEQALNYHKEISSEFYTFLYPEGNTSSEVENSSTLQTFLSKLDPQKQYMFLLQNNRENRIVCDAPEYPTVYHVGTFVNGELETESNVSIHNPPQVSFSNWDELKEYVEKVNYKHFQGIIVYNGAEQIKILNSNYKKLYALRGNEASIKNRYLYLRGDSDLRKEFIGLYPEYEIDFDTYEKALHEIGIQIFNAYMNRFIHKQHVVLYPEEYNVLKECHAWHISNRSRNRVSLTKVFEILNAQEPPRLNKMIRRYLNIEKTESDRNDTTRRRAIPSRNMSSIINPEGLPVRERS